MAYMLGLRLGRTCFSHSIPLVVIIIIIGGGGGGG